MGAVVPVIFVLVLLGAVWGYVKPKQVVALIVFLLIGSMLISIALNTGTEMVMSLPLILKIATLAIALCIVIKLVFPGNTWLLVLNFIILLPFRIAGWFLEILFELFGYKRSSTKKSIKRPNINY